MNNLPKVVAQQRRGRASNPRLLDRKSDALPLSLVGRPRRPVVRQAYVIEDVVVPPWTEVNIPVRLTWTAFERGVNNTEWVMETKHTPQGVIVSRSLLPKEGSKTFVRAVNLSDQH